MSHAVGVFGVPVHSTVVSAFGGWCPIVVVNSGKEIRCLRCLGDDTLPSEMLGLFHKTMK